MIHLRIRTEYSFRQAFGRMDDVLALLATMGPAHAVTDNGTWGHVNFSKAAKKAGIKPIFGVTLPVVLDARKRERQPFAVVTLLARTTSGLREMYRAVSAANSKALFYYYPRLDWSDINSLSAELYVLIGHGGSVERVQARPNVFLALCPTSSLWNRTAMSARAFSKVVVCDNNYPQPADAPAYEILSQRNKVTRTTPMHILTEDELRLAVPEATDEHFLNAERIAADCNASLPKADNVHIQSPSTLRELCIAAAPALLPQGLDVTAPAGTETYGTRLDRELAMIESKKFEDYFFLVGDMVRWAKTKMLVGPARGSSAGSLVCYLLGITDVDPLVHDLMFERFIDITRADLPDVDIDFQDDRRDLVIDYLRERYGAERVGRIGTVARLKAKSALGDVARELQIPSWEIRDVQDAVIERSSGDARAQFCVQDALETLEVGKALMAKYPAISIAGRLEGHAQHTGKHAAGVIVAQEPVENYCAIDNSGAAQIDKKDAEVLNMLKIDALGLRVLSVIQDTLDQIGKTRDWLVSYPLTDVAAFEVLNAERYSGIFQFEGYALQSLTRQMKIASFDDLAVIGALARPGPLHCGAATQFIARRIGNEAVAHMHALIEPITRDTYGVVIYQEQVMAIGRTMGHLSWEDVSELRKAMSKSMGEEFFNRYWERFREGSREHGIPDTEARGVWERMCTFGSWAFNKSHGISYGIISYWCCVLKAHWPLEFAAACLRNAKDDEQGVLILRDLKREGFDYVTVDPERSGLTWSVVNGKLLGGLTNVKGLGVKKAQDILLRRQDGRPLLPGQRKLLENPRTPYDDIFEAERRFGDIYKNPRAHHVTSGSVSYVHAIGEPGEYVFIARLREKKLRDLNEYGNVVKRGGRTVKNHPLFLNLVVEDDTGSVICRISRWKYPRWGKPIIEKAKIGDWFMFKGSINDDGWRMVQVTRWRALDEESPLFKNPPQEKTTS